MRLISLSIAFVLLACGCASQLPVPQNHPLTFQKKLRSAHHWDVIADDVADRTRASLPPSERGPNGKPLYIAAPPENTPFNRAFHNFLVTRMVNRGIPVSSSRDNAREIRYEIQLVRHNSSRYTHIPGTLTALAAGVSVIRGLSDAGSWAIPGALGAAGLADFGSGHFAGWPTATELIITTSITEGSTYMLRKTDVYYIYDADTDLFVEALERPVKQWQIVGK
ncbi:hypothetical protein [Geobacter sp. DSM 9736]|uniref:hypothetical protein n=1 Tax=Geobacter sp. DSM 9736 TaxID=1277350 RepID=UPI000B50F9F1|nr:hypothetical protein [Geobacter sp. DSM 9736]SNB46077.1 hypothetical protein SAMN06269301_1517 [Geobacter sp. DSM 9736]